MIFETIGQWCVPFCENVVIPLCAVGAFIWTCLQEIRLIKIEKKI